MSNSDAYNGRLRDSGYSLQDVHDLGREAHSATLDIAVGAQSSVDSDCNIVAAPYVALQRTTTRKVRKRAATLAAAAEMSVKHPS